MDSADTIVQVGKNGLTDSVLSHITRVLKQKKMVKVKFLRSSRENESLRDAAARLVEASGASRSKVVGFVVTLYK